MADIIAAKTVEDRMVVIASDEVSPDDVANDVIGIDSKEKREKARTFIYVTSFIAPSAPKDADLIRCRSVELNASHLQSEVLRKPLSTDVKHQAYAIARTVSAISCA